MFLEQAHPILRYGVSSPVVVRSTGAALILYDQRNRSAIWTAHYIAGASQDSNVDRKDSFAPDYTQFEGFVTKAADYAAWNKANPDNPMDQGHLSESRSARANAVEQRKTDMLIGVVPQTPEANRGAHTWRGLEDDVFNLGKDNESAEIIAMQGPGWDPKMPLEMLDSGQFIPHFTWKSVLFEDGTGAPKVWSFICDNNKEPTVFQVSLHQLANMIGFELWTGIRNTKFKRENKPNASWINLTELA